MTKRGEEHPVLQTILLFGDCLNHLAAMHFYNAWNAI